MKINLSEWEAGDFYTMHTLDAEKPRVYRKITIGSSNNLVNIKTGNVYWSRNRGKAQFDHDAHLSGFDKLELNEDQRLVIEGPEKPKVKRTTCGDWFVDIHNNGNVVAEEPNTQQRHSMDSTQIRLLIQEATRKIKPIAPDGYTVSATGIQIGCAKFLSEEILEFKKEYNEFTNETI